VRYALKTGFIVFLGMFHCAAAQEQPASPTIPSVQQQVAMPSAEKIVLLIRSTLGTLNDAIQTGNFTVLRDMGAPSFREANSATRLGQAFSDIASKGIDLSAVAVIAPQLTEAPALDQQKAILHLKGYFPGKPVQIDFELLYQVVEGRWRVFGLSVQPTNSTAQTPSVTGETSRAPSKK
jgi:hypothetical protein